MKTDKLIIFLASLFFIGIQKFVAQDVMHTPRVPDMGNSYYNNPVIYADYSDPDVIRVNDDYYMVSSSFGHFPGLPVLHSKDLINWKIIGHAITKYPFPEFEKPQHGMAVWAPSIRYYNNEYYIYFGDPDRGVFMTKSSDPAGPWEPLRHVKKVTGWIDCCPFWDEDGSAYLVHAFANSRCGIKSILAINKMSPDGLKIFDDGILVFNGQQDHITIEGPKLYKRNGYYYIFAPAGGVKTGWQTILRSKNIFGPYEDKIVLEQGSTKINGPHQGAWINTINGEDWFIHFQDRYAYGRIIHLQPMKWENDWPVMGIDFDKNGIGEPVSEFVMPNVGKKYPREVPQTNDEFDGTKLGLQWQWNSNYNDNWYSLSNNPGYLRLFSEHYLKGEENLWNIGRLLLQKFPAPGFTAEVKLNFHPVNIGERAGLLVFGLDYSYIGIEKTESGYSVSHIIAKDAKNGYGETQTDEIQTKSNEIYFKVEIYTDNIDDIKPNVMCDFKYSIDGQNYKVLGKTFQAKEGLWVGAKVGVFALSPESPDNNYGYVDIDWFKITNLLNKEQTK